MTSRCIISLSLAALVLLTGCRRTLWYDYGGVAAVEVAPDWSGSGGTPRGCETFVYRDGELYTTVLSKDIHHVSILLPEGDYTFLTVSYSESEYGTLEFIGKESLSSIGVRSAFHSATKDAGEVAMEPEWIAAGLSLPASIVESDVRTALVPYRDWARKAKQGQSYGWEPYVVSSLPVRMVNLVSEFKTSVYVRGADRVMYMVMHVDGLSDGWDIVADRPSATTATSVVGSWKRSLTKDTSDGVFVSSVATFGLPEGVTTLPQVSLDFTLSDGETVHHVDVGEVEVQSVRDDETGEWRMVIDIRIGSPDNPVVLPQGSGSQGTGTDAWVDGWADGGDAIVPV